MESFVRSVNYFWCWSSFTETNHMQPTLKQYLIIFQHWWCLFKAQNAKIIQFFYLHLISEADFAFILVSFLTDIQLRYWGKIWTFCYSYWCPVCPPTIKKNVTCITWSEAPLRRCLSTSLWGTLITLFFIVGNCFSLAIIHSGNFHKYFCLCQAC